MATPTILIVDDNTVVRRTIVALVQELGFAVTEAASAERAQEIMETDRFDALLCDDDLGDGLSGSELLTSGLTAMPAIVALMSGQPRSSGLPRHIRYLPKPFTIVQLEDALSGAP